MQLLRTILYYIITYFLYNIRICMCTTLDQTLKHNIYIEYTMDIVIASLGFR